TAAPPGRSEITFLGTLGLVPFVVGAIVVWAATPVTGTQQPSLVAQSMVLTYGGVIAAYMAGMGAGGLLFGPQTSREPMILGMVATLTAWLAVWTNLPFGIEIPLAWRHGLVLLVLVYILLRDLRAIEFGNMPSWYGGLRIFLTSVAGVSIFAVMIWLIANSQY
ncbi:MAG: DUF3429 domain-containing protein, partial [Pseudomonadota bacterium]